MKKLINFFKEDDGATMVEYAIMVALIAAVGIVAVRPLGVTVFDTFSDADGAISGGGGGTP